MLRQHDIGMRGGNRGVEDRAQERASVGHEVTRGRPRTCKALIHPISPKENPRKQACGGD
jgi:hypothetical protein